MKKMHKAALFSGHYDLTKQEFNKWYLEELDRSIEDGSQIVISDQSGLLLPLVCDHCTKSNYSNILICSPNGRSISALDQYMISITDYDVVFLRKSLPGTIPKSLHSRSMAYVLGRCYGSSLQMTTVLGDDWDQTIERWAALVGPEIKDLINRHIII